MAEHHVEVDRILGLQGENRDHELNELAQTIRQEGPNRRRHLKSLIRLATDHDALPPSLMLAGVVRQGNEPIAGGSFSDVWIGEYNQQKIAVKILRMFQNHDYNNVKKDAAREAIFWYSVNHPNVQPFLGLATFGDPARPRYGLVTPYMEDGDVITYLQKHPDVSRRDMIKGIASGLNAIHLLDIVHADLKGGNILVDEKGQPRLTDVGLSKLRSTYAISSGLANAMGGTLQFNAPELLLPEQELFLGRGQEYCKGEPTTRSDVYALAMTTIQIFTLGPPFGKIREQQIILRIVHEKFRPDRPHDVLGELDDGLWTLIQSAWAPHPVDRPSMEDFLRRFNELKV